MIRFLSTNAINVDGRLRQPISPELRTNHLPKTATATRLDLAKKEKTQNIRSVKAEKKKKKQRQSDPQTISHGVYTKDSLVQVVVHAACGWDGR